MVVYLASHNYPPNPSKGFNDPRSPFSEQPDYAGTPTYGPYPVDGDDYEMPSGHGLGEPDTNRLAQGEGAESHDALINLRENRQTGIQTATQPNLTEVSDEAVAEERGSFDELIHEILIIIMLIVKTMDFIVQDSIHTITFLNLSLVI